MQKDWQKIVQNAQLFYGCLHFRYNGKKYLYGLSQELLTSGLQTGFLSKLNGTYEPSERQKQQKSSLLLKKEKIALKIDYFIIPRVACTYQYLWHFTEVFKRINCRHFLILSLTKQQKKLNDISVDFTIKKKIINMILSEQEQLNSVSSSSLGYKFQLFIDHQNVMCKTQLKIMSKPNLKQSNQIEGFDTQDKIEIYEQTLNEISIQLCKKQAQQFSSKSIFRHLNIKPYLQNIQEILNTITYNSQYQKSFQLTQQQINEKKQELSKQIIKISTSQQVFYPTDTQQIKLLFLPSTNMITILHKHQIVLINPTNLASWRFNFYNLPVSKVKKIVLTRFSMAFMEFIIEWNVIGQKQKIHTFIQIVTLDYIYSEIKTKLRQIFLWTDEMIRAKISFRVITSSLNKFSINNQSTKHQINFYPLGVLKICYLQEQTRQDKWIFKFGNKQFCFLNEIIVVDQNWYKKYEMIIFDKIDSDIKKSLYNLSQANSVIKDKFIYNRSSISKFKNKYFYYIEENNPCITILSQLRIQQSFIPYFSSQLDSQRYDKIKLFAGQSINCLDRNIVILQGLVMVIYQKQKQQQQQNSKNKLYETKVHIVYPCDYIKNGKVINLQLNKIRNVKQLICLKQSLILVQQLQNQTFYQNLLSKSTLKITHHQQNVQLTTGNKQNINLTILIPFNNPFTIKKDSLLFYNLLSNNLIKLLSNYASNFIYTYISTNQIQHQKSQSKQTVEQQSPFVQMSKIFKKATLQSGQQINSDNLKVYFILKGCLKWKTNHQNQPKATNNTFIGNLQSFYQHKIIEQNYNKKLVNRQSENQIYPIQVVKDTWALQADLNELHDQFLSKYPEVAYWILSKGKIFS